MFTDVLLKRNPDFIRAAVTLHQKGKIQPDTYCIDLDTLSRNAAALLEAARKNGITPYFMLKQLGNNTQIARMLLDIGWPGAVAVDFKSAKVMMAAGVPVCHLGHLVQPPSRMLESFLRKGIGSVTIFSLEKAEEIQSCAAKLGIRQNLTLRVLGPQDTLYPGQYGGFSIEELPYALERLSAMPNLTVHGITSFPCFLFNEDTKRIEPQPNIRTIHQAMVIMRGAGIEVEQVNLPSCNCVDSMKLVAENGGTHAEPGHSLTGTTPYNACYAQSSERPAVLYLSEISHNLDGSAYLFGGGFYSRGHMARAYVGNSFETLETLDTLPFASGNIDYYLPLARECAIGDSVVMCFRTQIFVTRSDVALLGGIAAGTPYVAGRYDASGNRLE